MEEDKSIKELLEEKDKYIKRLKHREFLNKDEALHAFVSIFAHCKEMKSLRFSGKEEEKTKFWTCIDLSISDCNRIVTLDFGFDIEQERQDALYKVQKLEEALAKLREFIETVPVTEED